MWLLAESVSRLSLFKFVDAKVHAFEVSLTASSVRIDTHDSQSVTTVSFRFGFRIRSGRGSFSPFRS
jgi:hypothetical protein